MRFLSVLTRLAVLGIVLGSPTTPSTGIEIQKYAGDVVSGSYLVVPKNGVTVLSLVLDLKLDITHHWGGGGCTRPCFAGLFSAEQLELLRKSPDIEAIYENGLVHASYPEKHQTNATWGLERIGFVPRLPDGSNSTALTYKYDYDPQAGKGVDVYVIDTGVYVQHTEFGGRAKWGAAFGGLSESDENGHGTHCAGTIAGIQFGVAKAANIIAVRVLDQSGSGTLADVISGLEYACNAMKESKRPSIASLSLGGGASQPLDDAVAKVTEAGLHVVVAAGNFAEDANFTSPARAPSAITVGASDITDTRAWFSNFGGVVDVFAPGVDITSAWNTGPNATDILSGTSMATPHVAGLVASLISKCGNKKPSEMSKLVKGVALKDVLLNIPNGTVNLLAHLPRPYNHRGDGGKLFSRSNNYGGQCPP